MTQIEIAPIETADKENHENSHEDERKTIGCEPPDKVWTARAILVIATTFMSMFLVALDRTIIATAIPSITDEFDSLPDVGWYGSAYTLTACSLQLLIGKIYAYYPIKPVLLLNVLLFEIGSVVCGAAPSSAAFIVGRAIAGIGASGISAGAIMCIVYAVPLEKRAAIQGCFGALFGLASIVGPLIGGAFTTNVTWRWCFYINLPFGGMAIIVMLFCLSIPDSDATKLPWSKKLSQLDFIGTSALIPSMICLLLALQWGGQTYAWSNSRIIALLIVMGVLFIAFIAVQILLPNTATLPPRIIKQQSIMAGLWSTICIGASSYVYIYFLPIWFQSITGVSAVESGIRMLPFVISMVVASMSVGWFITKIGYYTPSAIFGACMMCVGAGLLTTLQLNTGEGKWIGYQILYGFGMGLSFQAPALAAQTVLPTKDVPIGSSLTIFGQLLGATIFISVGENTLDNQLLKRLSGLPGVNPNLITTSGATSLLRSVPDDLRVTVLVAYNDSLRVVFKIGLIMACLGVLGSAGLEWKSMHKKPPKRPNEAENDMPPVGNGK